MLCKKVRTKLSGNPFKTVQPGRFDFPLTDFNVLYYNHNHMMSMDFIEFERFRDLVYQYSSIFFTEKKKAFLEGKLWERIQALNLPSYEAYYRFLREENTLRQELSLLMEALVIRETSFFRIKGHFLELERRIFPELIAQKAKESRFQPSYQKFTIQVWSAACSTGEEPYSIAMSFLETSRASNSGSIQILATDISNSALTTAKKGVYSKDKVKKVEPRYLQNYFEDVEGTYYRIAGRVQRLVKFEYLNLTDLAKFHPGYYDLIFCRNVLIYFDRKAQNLLLERVTNLLLPGSYLFLGDVEPLHTFPEVAKKFEFVEAEDAIIYRKR